MHLPTLFPDELDQGYFSRVAMLNSIEDPLFQYARMKNLIMARGFRFEIESWAECIAALTGQPAIQFVRRHTLIPFYFAIQPNEGGPWEEIAAERSRLLLRCRTRPKRWWMFCPQCASEDLQFWGVSYWRRSHQLPGCVWCSKHEVGLQSAADPNAVKRLPHTIADFHQPNPDVVSDALSNATIRRYADLCSAFLESSHYYALYDVVHVLNVKCRQLDLEVGPESTCGNKWKALTAEKVTGCWHDEVATQGRRSDRIAADRSPALLNSLSAVRAIGEYAFVLSLMYESAEEALLDLSRASGVGEVGRRTAREQMPREAAFSAEPDTARSAEAPTTRALELFLDGASIGDACHIAGSDIQAFERELRHHMARVSH